MRAQSQARRSLEGRRVMVTRAATVRDPLVDMLEARGARTIRVPAIVLIPADDVLLDGVIEELAEGRFEWVLFTSRMGAEVVAKRLAARGMDGSAVRASVAAVGEGTARALAEAGIRPTLVPDTFTTQALAQAMPAGSGRVLLARADIAGDELEAALEARGWTPVRVAAYRTVFPGRLPADVVRDLKNIRLDAVTFTSASTVEGLRRALGSWRSLPAPRPKVVCIGPVTASAARREGLDVDAIATPHTIEGLVSALEAIFTSQREE
ncbi:MAG TPA: uroporphyrinogen-III synthase [Actinomycetota bacterium]|nr:uroporphyrinogen-III synthase [Actinomycetota bacterium]